MEWSSYFVNNLNVSDLNDWDPGNLDAGQDLDIRQVPPSTNARTCLQSADHGPSDNNCAQYFYAPLDPGPLESAAWTNLGLYDFGSNDAQPPMDDTARTKVPNRISSGGSTSRATSLASTVPMPKAPMSTVHRNSRVKDKVPHGHDRNQKQKQA
jgi:hypothetical protein